MAYYDALISAWNAGGKPNGATGTSITGGMSTQDKIDAVNGWLVSGDATPMIVEAHKILNAIDVTEYKALSAAQKDVVRLMLSMGSVDVSPNTQGHALLLDTFGTCNTTKANFVAIANTFKNTIPWWKANGYRRAFDLGDAAQAGLN